MARARADFNIQRRVSIKGGWIFLGVSLGSAVRTALVDLNDEGYRVAFMVPDQPELLLVRGAGAAVRRDARVLLPASRPADHW